MKIKAVVLLAWFNGTSFSDDNHALITFSKLTFEIVMNVKNIIESSLQGQMMVLSILGMRSSTVNNRLQSTIVENLGIEIPWGA